MKKQEKKKYNLWEKQARRKYHIPNKIIYFLYWFIMTKLVAPKYRPKYIVEDDINECEGPCFLIWNHLSRLDHLYVMACAYPRRINIMASYIEFFRSHLHTVFKLNQIIPKKNYTNDIPGMKAMNSIIAQNGVVCFAPEGMSSIFGSNQPIIVGTGHMLKHYRIPVYYVEMRGQYLTTTKCNLEERPGYTQATMKLLYTPKQLEALSDTEIDDQLNTLFRHDDYAWNKEKRIRYNCHGRGAEHLEEICFRCPKCGKDLTLSGVGNKLTCSACGNGCETNDYYDYIPFDDTCVIPESPVKWMEWEREQLIREIRADENYSYSVACTLGDIPKDHWIPKKKTAEVCGSGTFTVDHQGIHFTGTRRGEAFAMDMDYNSVFSLIIETDTTNCGIFYKGEYLEFTPEVPAVGKMLILTEEMHRLHVNSWKNFPWYDYMYEEKE